MSEPPDNPSAPGMPEGHVFIVTYGRSGSTLLQNLLNHIDGYCIRGENNNALFHLARGWDALAAAEQIRGQRAALETCGTMTAPDHPWYGAEDVEPDELGRALAASFVRTVLRPPKGTRVAGFKEIRFHLAGPHLEAYTGFLTRFFPRARFVFNTRDHAAVARSGWWAQMDPDKVRRQLEAAEEGFAKMRALLGDRAIALHYDDYVGRPEALEPLFDFLGEPFDAERVRAITERRLVHTGVKEQ